MMLWGVMNIAALEDVDDRIRRGRRGLAVEVRMSQTSRRVEHGSTGDGKQFAGHEILCKRKTPRVRGSLRAV